MSTQPPSPNGSESPTPGTLIGTRIRVRPYIEADARALFDAVIESDTSLRPWMLWVESHRTVEDSLEYIRRSKLAFQLRTEFAMGIFERRSGRYLGGTGFHLGDTAVPSFEIGYWIRASAAGTGYVSEAVRLLTACAFGELRAERLVIRCDARNDRSRRVAERQGYVFEGRLRHVQRDATGNLADMLVYAMVRADFERARTNWRE